MGDDAPQDPITAMAEAAAGLHELFTAYTAAGFTEPQAMHLLTVMVEAHMRAAMEGP